MANDAPRSIRASTRPNTGETTRSPADEWIFNIMNYYLILNWMIYCNRGQIYIFKARIDVIPRREKGKGIAFPITGSWIIHLHVVRSIFADDQLANFDGSCGGQCFCAEFINRFNAWLLWPKREWSWMGLWKPTGGCWKLHHRHNLQIRIVKRMTISWRHDEDIMTLKKSIFGGFWKVRRGMLAPWSA